MNNMLDLILNLWCIASSVVPIDVAVPLNDVQKSLLIG